MIEYLADGVTLYCGDCLEVMATLPDFDAVITDPPYEAVMQNRWGVINETRRDRCLLYFDDIGFDAIDAIRGDVAAAIKRSCRGWAVIFCMAEGVRAWRDVIEATGGNYKRAMVWVKPDGMPQFNGQGPSVGHEMMVSAWYGRGHARWNGGGRKGVFTYGKSNGRQHPAQKPVPLMRELVALFSNPGDVVCDPFLGSGTTGVAAVRLGRKFVGIERDRKHFSLACKRIAEALSQPDLFMHAGKPQQLELL